MGKKTRVGGIKLPNPGTKQWEKEILKALSVPGFKITLSDRCKEPEGYEHPTTRKSTTISSSNSRIETRIRRLYSMINVKCRWNL